MNKKEIIRAVAKRTKVPVLLADDAIEAFLDIVTLNLSAGEEVSLRGFGRLETRSRGAKTLRHPGTGEPLELAPYRTVVFLPSDVLKERLNNPPSLAQLTRREPKFHYRTAKRKRPKKPRDRGKERRDMIHKHLWARRDRRNRLAVDIGDVANQLAMHYDTANRAIISMRREGRIHAVGWKHPRTRVYEITDPTKWRADDPSTHRPPPAEPAWG